jgi:hypothetical protein
LPWEIGAEGTEAKASASLLRGCFDLQTLSFRLDILLATEKTGNYPLPNTAIEHRICGIWFSFSMRKLQRNFIAVMTAVSQGAYE